MSFASILTDLGGAIASMFASVAQTLSGIFFTVSESGAVTITGLGYIALIGLTLSIVWALFRFIAGLVRGRAGR